MPRHESHGYSEVLDATVEEVWGVMGDFTTRSWNLGSATVVVTPELVRTPGFVRTLTTNHGNVVHEELVNLGPGRTLTYRFVGTPPVRVLDSLTTVSAESVPEGTRVCWFGESDVVDDATARTVRQTNTEQVWPRLALAASTTLRVRRLPDPSIHPEGNSPS